MKYSVFLAKNLNTNRYLRSSYSMKMLFWVAHRMGSLSSPFRTLHILDALPDCIRGIMLGIIARWFPDGDLCLCPAMDPKIYQDLISLLVDLEMVDYYSSHRPVLAEPFRDAVRAGPSGVEETLRAARRGPLCRIQRRQESIRRISHEVICNSLIFTGSNRKIQNDLYLLNFYKYIKELSNISLEGQVSASLPERFYSDLGSLAFQLYTGPRVRRLYKKMKYSSFLDVGCGNGLYLRAAAEAVPGADIVGVDLQENVVEDARDYLSDLPEVSVYQRDFLTWNPGRLFDVIFACYMLFYLTSEQRLIFFSKIAKTLSQDGRFVLVQYVPDAQPVQQALIQKYSYLSRSKEHIARIGVSLCHAETLLNRCLDTFKTVVYWEDLLSELKTAGLEIDSIYAADSMYYSMFFIIRRS